MFSKKRKEKLNKRLRKRESIGGNKTGIIRDVGGIEMNKEESQATNTVKIKLKQNIEMEMQGTDG